MGSVLIDTPISYGGMDGADLTTLYSVNAVNVVAMPDADTNATHSLFLGASKDVVIQSSEDTKIILGSSNVLRVHDDADVASLLVSTDATTTTLSSASKNLVLSTNSNDTLTFTVGATTLSQSNDYQIIDTTMASGFRMKDNLYVEGFGTVEDSLSVGGNAYINSNVFAQHYNVFKYNASNDRSAVITGYAFTINSNDQLELVKYTSFSNGEQSASEVKKRVAVFGTSKLRSTDGTDVSYAEFGNINMSLNGGDTAVIGAGSSSGSGNLTLTPGAITTTYLSNQAVTSAKLAPAAVTASKIDTTTVGLWSVASSNVYFATSSNAGSGCVGIGTSTPEFKLDVNGNIHARKSVTSSSDARLKTDLAPIEGALDKMLSLTGYTYARIGQPAKEREAGLLAQQVRQVLPEVVHEDSQGMLSVAYGNMVALIVQAMREMNDKIAALSSSAQTAGVAA